MRQTGTLRAFLQLNGRDRALACKSALALLSTWAGLRLFGFSFWKNVVTRFSASKPPYARLTLLAAQQLAQLTSATARRLFFRTNCLEQSLVLWFLLRRRGVPAVLRFGGRKTGDQFEAHAWVEWQGTILNDDSALCAQFTPFEPLDEPLATLEKYSR